MKKIRAVVTGKVQGVSYRMYTRSQAQQLGVLGYVRNLSNGDVEIIATGKAESVDALIKWAYSGSPSAIVTNIEVKPITDVEDFQDFVIRY